MQPMTMDYPTWRAAIFGQPEGSEAVSADLSFDIETMSADQSMDHVVKAMDDAQIHEQFTVSQIGIGIQLLFDNSCSNIVFAYRDATEDKRIAGVRAIGSLYRNYFGKYCTEPVERVGYSFTPGLGYMCYMLWDLFILRPDRMPQAMLGEVLRVLEAVLSGDNEQCQASALHGLGHWVSKTSEARRIIGHFITTPRERTSPVILAYASQAMTGCIQ